MSQDLIQRLIGQLGASNEFPMVLTDCNCNDVQHEAYQQAKKSFNRKFDFRPAAIIYVENSAQVSKIVKFANAHKESIALRVRSGGHDHEAESNGTDTLLIDFSKMKRVHHVPKPDECADEDDHLFIGIEPGARFTHIKSVLDAHDLGIPHGTCKTVGIAGFTLGGGWGPWTRKYGMACESLVGATIVLGNGEIKEVSIDDNNDSAEGRLLWALRGGGGLSYGIVTEFRFKAFVLPEITYSFSLGLDFLDKYFPNINTLQILTLWEEMIKPDNSKVLIGTNLKINTKPIEEGTEPDPNAKLSCLINGYIAGSPEDFIAVIVGWIKILENIIGDKPNIKSDITRVIKAVSDSASAKMWLKDKADALGIDVNPKNWRFEGWDRRYHDLKLDSDGPAPHKITSRLADCGWNNESRKALICSLQSSLLAPLLCKGDNQYGIHTYITIGAISGEFYKNYKEEAGVIGSAFPYKDRLFTLQYQAWWDEFLDVDGQMILPPADAVVYGIENRKYINRTEDWIERCRNYDIAHTGGAFISFKDASVTTADYFSDSYDDLKEVKENYSQDDNLLLRSRKTII